MEECRYVQYYQEVQQHFYLSCCFGTWTKYTGVKKYQNKHTGTKQNGDKNIRQQNELASYR
jgi:hypothetical protein